MSTTRPRISTRTKDILEDVMEEYDVDTYDEAIRRLAIQSGYDA